MTLNIVRAVGTWPYLAAKQNPGAWVEISAEHYEYCHGVLPPIYYKGGFAVSEPMDTDDRGIDTFFCCVADMKRERYYAREIPRDRFAIETEELRSSFAFPQTT